MWQLSPGAENLERRWQAMFTSQKPLLPAWQTGWGRGPAGGRSRFIDDDAAERPGEIKVKGSSPAEEEARPLFINQRGWDRAKRCRGCREEGDGRRLPVRSAPTRLGGSQARPCLLPLRADAVELGLPPARPARPSFSIPELRKDSHWSAEGWRIETLCIWHCVRHQVVGSRGP